MCLSVRVCVCVTFVHICAPRHQKAYDFLAMESQAVVGGHVGAWFSVRALSVLSPRAISLDPILQLLFLMQAIMLR